MDSPASIQSNPLDLIRSFDLDYLTSVSEIVDEKNDFLIEDFFDELREPFYFFDTHQISSEEALVKIRDLLTKNEIVYDMILIKHNKF